MLSKPRSRNRRKPRASLIWPNTGSTITLRLAYKCSPCGRPHFRGHALLARGGLAAAPRLWGMVALTAGGHVRIKSLGLHVPRPPPRCNSRCQGGRDLLRGARGVCGHRNTSLLQVSPASPGAMGSACCLSLLASRDVTRHNDLVGGIHTRLGIAAILPAFVVGPHDLQLGIGEVGLRFVSGVSSTGLGALPATRGWPAAAVPLRLRLAAGARPPLRLWPAPPDAAWPPRSWPSGLHGASVRQASSSPRRLPRAASSAASCWCACVTRVSMSSRKRSASFAYSHNSWPCAATHCPGFSSHRWRCCPTSPSPPRPPAAEPAQTPRGRRPDAACENR